MRGERGIARRHVVFAFFTGTATLPRAGQLAWFIGLVALTAPPVVWENIVRGFDSQHYLLIGFSLGAIVGLMTAPAGAKRWWAGLGCAVIALFTMGSGLIAAVVVLVTLLAAMPLRTCWQRHRWTVLACLVVIAVGVALRHEVPAHAAHRSRNVQKFTIAFWHHLQWPLVHHSWFGLISSLPWAFLALRCVRRDPSVGGRERVVVAVGLWALAHYVAMAYMRGSIQPWPPTRGLENVVVGLAANLFALLIFLARPGRSKSRATLQWTAALAGLAVGVYGLGSIVRENVTIVLSAVAAHARLAERNTRAFLATGDQIWLKPGEIPYPDAASYAALLSVPEIQRLLPASVRQPVDVRESVALPGTFELGGARGTRATGSKIACWLAGCGGWIVLIGMVLSATGWSRALAQRRAKR